MKAVKSTSDSPAGQEKPASGTLGAAHSTEMFEPIRGIDPDFGPPLQQNSNSTSWWSWLQPNKSRG